MLTTRNLRDEPSLQRVSTRQQQVLAQVAAGLSDKEIAIRLGLSCSTVKTYLSRFYRYHGVKNRAQAVAIFISLGSLGWLDHGQRVAGHGVVDAASVSFSTDSRNPDYPVSIDARTIGGGGDWPNA